MPQKGEKDNEILEILSKDSPYIVKVPIFEGPLDLLLHLVRKNKLNILDLPISLITEQYLQYLEIMKALDIDIAGEYLLMAATLIYIKSQFLIPKPQEETEEYIDPRVQIVEPLLELAKYQEAARWLTKRPWLGRDVFLPSKKEENKQEKELKVSLFDLLSTWQRFLQQEFPSSLEIKRSQFLLQEKLSEIERLLRQKGRIFFSELCSKSSSREEIIAYFLALLELSFRHKVSLIQNHKNYDDIEIIYK